MTCVLPHGSVIVVQLMDVIAEGVPVVLMPHWVLVHGSIGLGGGVEGRRDAVTGLAAVVTVPVINGTVWVLVCSHNTVGDEMKLGCEAWTDQKLLPTMLFLVKLDINNNKDM